MDSKQGLGTSAVANARVDEDFDPHMEWAKEDSSFDTLLVYLPGFLKDKLKIQITSAGKLRLSGERAMGQNKFRRFLKEFPLASNCDTNKISAKFEGGILYVKVPKSSINSTNINTNTDRPVVSPSPQPSQPATKDHQQTHPQSKPKPSVLDQTLAPKSDQKPQQVPPKPAYSQEKQPSDKKPMEKIQPNDDIGDASQKKSGVIADKAPGSEGSKLEKKPEGKAAEKAALGKTLSRLETYKKAIVQGLSSDRVKSPRALVNLLLAVLFVGVLALYVKNMFRSIGHVKSDGNGIKGEL